jgi:hypothetical protein
MNRSCHQLATPRAVGIYKVFRERRFAKSVYDERAIDISARMASVERTGAGD